MFAQCMRDTERAVTTQVDPDSSPLQRLADLFVAMVPFGDRYHFLTHQHSGDPDNLARYQAELDWLAALVAELRHDGVIDASFSDAWIVAQLDQLVWSAWSEVAAGRLAPAEAPQLALRTLLNGIGEKTE